MARRTCQNCGGTFEAPATGPDVLPLCEPCANAIGEPGPEAAARPTCCPICGRTFDAAFDGGRVLCPVCETDTGQEPDAVEVGDLVDVFWPARPAANRPARSEIAHVDATVAKVVENGRWLILDLADGGRGSAPLCEVRMAGPAARLDPRAQAMRDAGNRLTLDLCDIHVEAAARFCGCPVHTLTVGDAERWAVDVLAAAAAPDRLDVHA